MKKLFAIVITAAMLCAMVLPMTVSAAGIILWQDDFSTMREEDWIWDGSRFEVIDGHLEGDGVVHQTNYVEEYDGNKMWGDNTAYAAEMWALDDSGRGFTYHAIGLWWADYMAKDESDETPGRIVYSFKYYFEDKKVKLGATFEGETEELKENVQFLDEDQTILAEYDVPESEAPKMEMDKPDSFRIGFRVKNGVITVYFNDKLVITHEAERGAVCGTEQLSPLLMWNDGCYCCFDNVMVATADYNLFNESAVTEAVVTDPAQTEPVATKAPDTTKIEEVVVTEIGDDGEVVTKIETVIVTNAPAPDTQKQPTNPQGGAQTGDMAVIVMAVMVVCLGAAVVVKKVNQ